ncbi:NHLP bacteriocin export ABC transporter permease/ATPase subunit [Verrucomicrobia bacterium]|nr:NHLP bacteriocin export ABC transporter permease/ATPase subunit [Verrucomicrobiota bacterium]
MNAFTNSPVIELCDGENLPFDREDGFWIVEQGSADFYKINESSSLSSFTHVKLWTAQAGEILFGRSPSTIDGYNFEILSLEDSCVRFVKFEELSSLSNKAKATFAAKIDQWVQRCYSCIKLQPPAVQNITPDNNLSFTLVRGERMKIAGSASCWATVELGEISLLASESLKFGSNDSILPLAGGVWFEALEESKILIYSSYDLNNESLLLKAIASLQKIILTVQNSDERNQTAKEADRLSKASEMQQRQESLSSTLLANVLDPDKVIQDTGDDLQTVLGVIGGILKVEFKQPKISKDPERIDYIEALSQASGVRYRRVMLRGGWSHQDNGPLLVFYASDESADSPEPAALIPNKNKIGYCIYRRSVGRLMPIEDQDFSRLDPEAITFYKPYPSHARGFLDLGFFALDPFKAQLVMMLTLSIIVSLLGMLTPIAFQLIVDTAIPDGNRDLLFQIASCLLCIAIGSTWFSLGQGLATLRMKSGVTLTMQAAIIDRLLRLPVSFFKKYSSGDLVNRSMIITEIASEVSGIALKAIFASFTTLLNVFLLFYWSWRLAIIPIGLSLLSAIVTVIVGIRIRKNALEYEKRIGKVFGFLVQIVSGISKFRVAGAESLAHNEWSRKYSQLLGYLAKIKTWENFSSLFNSAYSTVGTILLYFFVMKMMGMGAKDASQPTEVMSMGKFLGFNVAFGAFMGGVTSLASTIVDIMDSLAKRSLCLPVLEAATEIDDNKIDPGNLNGTITIKDVSFRYIKDGPYILNSLNLNINAGSFVALVGPSGCGKSTLFRLLLGFEVPDSGSVFFDDQDLKGLNVNSLRKQIGTVLQSAVVSSGSIFENIADGEVITLDDAWAAAKDSGFSDDIKQMPMEMNTLVSEGGGNLSGGQRQRLLIARSLVRNPQILLFDEATSALDNRTQEIVGRSLQRRKVTRLVIAHRLSTIQDADMICVFEGGKITQQGTFDQLTSEKGLFRNMMQRQTL